MATNISSSSAAAAAALHLHSDLIMEPDSLNWNLLTPPSSRRRRRSPLSAAFVDNDERNEIGVIKLHPSLNRVAYATTRSQYINDDTSCREEGDIGETRIIVHDIDFTDMNCTTNIGSGKNNHPEIVASFTLHELCSQMNEFRNDQNRIMNLRERKVRSSNNSSRTITKTTVEMLGGVQNIDFLSCHAKISRKVTDEDEDGPLNLQHLRLIIGFRQCVVVVSIDQSIGDAPIRSSATASESRGETRGLQVIAYIGPDNLDGTCENHNEKDMKKLPSSFPVPISETIFAYGCYDGGIRFYDILRQRTVKSCLGPSGRNNPVVKMLLANKVGTNSDAVAPFVLRNNHIRHQNTTIIRRPRIISVSTTGDAYLWELELLDLDNDGEVVKLNVPPPLARMNGLVAAVSGSGMPVVYPPALSSTSIASLSPLSGWELMDEVNSQFEVSYDPQHDVFYWVFSPDCIGTSLKPQSSREEQLNTNAVMVCWRFAELTFDKGWPPPLLPPHCVVQLPRTRNGRVSTNMVAGPGFINHQCLTTFYVTSSDELMVVKADLKGRDEPIHLQSRVSMLTDLNKIASNDKRGFTCVSVAASSNINRPFVAIGTQYGVLFGAIAREKPIEKEPEQQHASPSSVHRFSDITFEQNWSFSEQQQSLLAERIHELECRNKELEFQLDEMIQEAHDTFSDMECSGLQSHLHDVLETELGTALTTIERLENDFNVKNESCEALERKVEKLGSNLDRVHQDLVQERHIHQTTMQKLAAAEEVVAVSEKDAACRRYAMALLQEECDDLRSEIVELIDDSDTCHGQRVVRSTENLQNELSIAKKAEESLRKHIIHLEEEMKAKDNDLKLAKQHAVEYSQKNNELLANVEAQELALESLVNLLDRQRIEYEKKDAARHEEIILLREQLSVRLN